MALIVDPRTMKKYSFFSRKGLLIFEKYSIEFKSLYKKNQRCFPEIDIQKLNLQGKNNIYNELYGFYYPF